MDKFGVLVQNYGIKPQGKSAPMAASKTSSRNLDQPFSTNDFSKSTHSSSSVIGSFLDKDDIFGFNSGQKPQNYSSSNVIDDVFQIPTKNSSFSNGGSAGFEFNMESVFMGSVNLNSNSNSSDVNDDLIWGFHKKNGSSMVNKSNDLLSSDPVDDFLGNLGNLGSNPGKRFVEKKGDFVDSDDLIPGFGRSNTTNDRAQASSTQKSAGSSYLDELEDFATRKIKKNASGNFDASRIRNELNKTSKHKSQETNFFDIEGSSQVNSFPNSEVERESEMMFQTEATDLDSFFSAHTQMNKPVSKDKSVEKKTEEVRDLFFGDSSEKKVPPSSFPDDFSSIFGGSPSAGQFEEVEGESEERRKARFGRHQRTEARMAKALADMNQREFKAQQEQEERHRIAEAMDVEIKRWVAGKEGNLRALLSSLQQVLGPEFGWRPVTLTDLITSSQVKIAYKKAALCVHPDKVQQKGASLQQKFVAEKVFDLLKEAWNKFNSEELR